MERDTLLHLASTYGNNTLVDSLLAQHVDVNAKNRVGLTPLHYAVMQQKAETVKKLLKAGAKPNLLDRDGHSPLYFSLGRNRNSPEIIRDLIEAGADLNWGDKKDPIFCKLCMNADEQLVIELLPNVQNLNLPDNEGRTPLYHAMENSKFTLAKKLIESGAEVNVRTLDNTSPLHLACVQDSLELIKILLDKGADPFARDNKMKTPFEYLFGAFAREQNYPLAMEYIRLKPEILDVVPFELENFRDEFWPELIDLMNSKTLTKSLPNNLSDFSKIIKASSEVSRISLLSKLDEDYFDRLIPDRTDLKFFVLGFPEEIRFTLLKSVGLPLLKLLLDSCFNLELMLEDLPEDKRIDFLEYLSQEFIQSIIISTFDYDQLKELLPLPSHPRFLELLGGVKFLRIMITDYLSLIAYLESSDNPLGLLNELGVEHIRFVVTNSYVLRYVLNLMTQSDRPHFLQELGEDQLKVIFKESLWDLKKLLELLESSERLELLNQLAPEFIQASIKERYLFESVLGALSDADKLSFIESFGSADLQALIKDSACLNRLLNIFPDSFKPDILALISVQTLKNISVDNYRLNIKNGAELGLILRAFPPSDYTDFLMLLGNSALSHILHDGKHLFVLLTKIPKDSRPKLMKGLNLVLQEKEVNKLIQDNDPNVREMIEGILPTATTSSPKNRPK